MLARVVTNLVVNFTTTASRIAPFLFQPDSKSIIVELHENYVTQFFFLQNALVYGMFGAPPEISTCKCSRRINRLVITARKFL